IITIEAEALPVEGNKEVGNVKEDENRKEPLSLLHVAEQEKVRKLISQYQKIREFRKKLVSKRMGMSNQSVSAMMSCWTSFDSFDEESSTVLQTISEVASICSNNTLPGMTATIAEERTVNLRTASVISPSVSVISPSSVSAIQPSSVSAIQPSVYDELFKKSSSISNFAKNLVFELFEAEELKDSNCSGVHQKKSLERDPHMDLIKESILIFVILENLCNYSLLY
ncbi:Hypothetical predicted protein, partial [Paramuricea clavata]